MSKKYLKYIIPVVSMVVLFGVYKLEYYISHKEYKELDPNDPHARLNDFFQDTAIIAAQKKIGGKNYIVIFEDGRKKLEFEAVSISPNKRMWFEDARYAIFMTPSNFIQSETGEVNSNISIVNLSDFSVKNVLIANENTSYTLRFNEAMIAMIEKTTYVNKENLHERVKKVENIDSLGTYLCEDEENCSYYMNENL